MTLWALATAALALAAAAAHALAPSGGDGGGGGGLCVGAEGHLVADPRDCRRYFSCGAGPRLHNCSCGRHFDAEREVCDWPANVHCEPHRRQGQEEFLQGRIPLESGQVTYNSSGEIQDKQLHIFSEILHKIYVDYFNKAEEIKENSGNETKAYGVEMVKNYPSMYNIQSAQTLIGIARQITQGLENERGENNGKKENFGELPRDQRSNFAINVRTNVTENNHRYHADTNKQEGLDTLGNISNIEEKIKSEELGFGGGSRSDSDVIKSVFSFVADSITNQERDEKSLKPSPGINISTENVKILPIEAVWGSYWPLAERTNNEEFAIRKSSLGQDEGKHTSSGSINITGNPERLANYSYTLHGENYNASVEISFTKNNNSTKGLQSMSMSVDHENKNESSMNIEIIHESGTPRSLLDELRDLLEKKHPGDSRPDVFTTEPNAVVMNGSIDMRDYVIFNGTRRGKDNETMEEYLKEYLEENLEEYLDEIGKNPANGSLKLKY